MPQPDSTPQLPTTGSDVVLTIYREGRPLSESKVQWENGTLNEVAMQYRDKLMGRRRDRVDKKVTGYDLTAAFLIGDFSIVEELEGIKAQVEAYQTIDTLSVGLEYTLRDGTTVAFVVGPATSKFSINMGGKDERNKLSLNIEAEDLDIL